MSEKEILRKIETEKSRGTIKLGASNYAGIYGQPAPNQLYIKFSNRNSVIYYENTNNDDMSEDTYDIIDGAKNASDHFDVIKLPVVEKIALRLEPLLPNINVGELIIPKGILKIGTAVFATSIIEKLDLKNTTLQIIDYAAFAELQGPRELTLPDTLETIGEQAFDVCNAENIIIPESVIEIGSDAFNQVAHIEYHGTATGAPWGALSMN